MKKNIKQLNALVVLGIALTILFLLALPLLLTAVLKVSGIQSIATPSTEALKISAGLYLSSIPYVLALFHLRKIVKCLDTENPFTEEVVDEFKQISTLAFIEAFLFPATQVALWAITGFFAFGLSIFSTVIVTFISITGGFLFKVLSGVYAEAVENKEEVDSTF